MRCLIKNCKNSNQNSSKNTKISFFRVPKKPEKRKKWFEILNITEEDFKQSSRVCSHHFHPDFIFKNGDAIQLTDDAIPSVSSDFQPQIVVPEVIIQSSNILENPRDPLDFEECNPDPKYIFESVIKFEINDVPESESGEMNTAHNEPKVMEMEHKNTNIHNNETNKKKLGKKKRLTMRKALGSTPLDPNSATDPDDLLRVLRERYVNDTRKIKSLQQSNRRHARREMLLKKEVAQLKLEIQRLQDAYYM